MDTIYINELMFISELPTHVPAVLEGGRADGKVTTAVYIMNRWHEDEETGDLYQPTGELVDGKLICVYIGHNADRDKKAVNA
jgi:hypothetical protein